MKIKERNNSSATPSARESYFVIGLNWKEKEKEKEKRKKNKEQRTKKRKKKKEKKKTYFCFLCR